MYEYLERVQYPSIINTMNNDYMLQSFVGAVDDVVISGWKSGQVVIREGWEIGISIGQSGPYDVIFHARLVD